MHKSITLALLLMFTVPALALAEASQDEELIGTKTTVEAGAVRGLDLTDTTDLALATIASHVAIASSTDSVEKAVEPYLRTSVAIAVQTPEVLGGQRWLIGHSRSEALMGQSSSPPASSAPPIRKKNRHYKAIAVIGSTIFVVTILVAVL